MATKKDKAIGKYTNKLYKSELPLLKEKLKREEEDIIGATIRWFTTYDDDDSNKKDEEYPHHPLKAKWWSINTNGCVQSVEKNTTKTPKTSKFITSMGIGHIRSLVI